MANFFREEEIEEFRQCFFFHVGQDSRGSDRTPVLKQDELKFAMRSLGLSPTLDEVRKYVKTHGGKIIFANFLDVLHKHKQIEQIPDDILEGFRVQDVKNKQTLPERDVRWMLQNFGERLTSQEVDQLFREGRASNYGNIQYAEFVKNVCSSRDAVPQNQRQTPQQEQQHLPNYRLNNNGFNYNEPRPDY
jgi:Ca2+-binding EF-hand superfamily protein